MKESNQSNERNVSFYCGTCRIDQDHPPQKRKNRFGEWFFAECMGCKEMLIRYITDKHLDPYYRNSLNLKKQRTFFAKDLIQPGDSRFKKYYKKEWDKIEVTSQIWEEKRKKEKESRESYREQFKYQPPSVKKIVNRVLEVEEQM